MFHGAGGFYNLWCTLYETPNRGMRICSMGPGDYDKEMLWQGNPLALEWWNQWGASSALGYGPPGHTLVLWAVLHQTCNSRNLQLVHALRHKDMSLSRPVGQGITFPWSGLLAQVPCERVGARCLPFHLAAGADTTVFRYNIYIIYKIPSSGH